MTDPAAHTYRAIAPIYDRFTAANDYETWLGNALIPELEKHGLKRGRVLDVGCGTGTAFEPMLRRRWEVTGCDLAPEMLAEARRKFDDTVTLTVADARELPMLGTFDLVWALNDVLNYMLEDGDLERALAGMRANLCPSGLLLFDVNTIGLFEAAFADNTDERMDRGGWTWAGETKRVEPGAVFTARLSGEGVETHWHHERHWTDEQIRVAIAAAGLAATAYLGLVDSPDGISLLDPPDEHRDPKVIYICRPSK